MHLYGEVSFVLVRRMPPPTNEGQKPRLARGQPEVDPRAARPYGHVHLLSQVISHRLDGSASKVTIFWFWEPKMSKLAFGSVKNESGAWDLPRDAYIYRCPHPSIDASASIYRWPHLFIDGRIYL